MARVIERTTDVVWAERITALASSIATGERCNAAAVIANRLELTYPDVEAVKIFLARSDAVVAISHDGDVLEAYLIVVDDRGWGGKMGGGMGRWVGLNRDIVPLLQRPSVHRGMLNVAADVFGWVWGRITNDNIRTFLANNMVDGAVSPEDPQILTFKRPV
jgi:hypothetical protein